MLARRALLLVPAFLTACSASPPPASDAPVAPPPPALATVAPSAEPAAQATPPPPPADAPHVEAASLPRAVVPAPLDAAEKQALAGAACKPVMTAFQAHLSQSKARGRLNVMLDGIKATLASPPPRAPEKCVALFEREMRGYVVATLGVEATVTLAQLARSMSGVLAESGKLCPSTTHPVPAELPAFYTVVPTLAWSDPTWSCLHFAGVLDLISVQYEVTTRADGATFVARGIPFPDEGKVVEWKLEARVKDGALVYDKPVIAP